MYNKQVVSTACIQPFFGGKEGRDTGEKQLHPGAEPSENFFFGLITLILLSPLSLCLII